MRTVKSTASLGRTEYSLKERGRPRETLTIYRHSRAIAVFKRDGEADVLVTLWAGLRWLRAHRFPVFRPAPQSACMDATYSATSLPSTSAEVSSSPWVSAYS